VGLWENGNEPSSSVNADEFLDHVSDHKLYKKDPASWRKEEHCDIELSRYYSVKGKVHPMFFFTTT